MASDHLDRETSVSAEVTETGIKANTKSRFVAAIDRFGGAVVDNFNARIEASTDRKRATSKGEVRLIESITEYGVQKLGASPELAERAFRSHFKKVIAAQENKDHVLLEARRELEANPPLEDVSGEISEDFFARFEVHAEAASSEQLRELFGRILAGEVRRPGSVSASTLHFVAMLEADTAKLIEKVSRYCIGQSCFIGLMPDKISTVDVATLELSGFMQGGLSYADELQVSNEQGGMKFDDLYLLFKAKSPLSLRIESAIISKTGAELLAVLGLKFLEYEKMAYKFMEAGATSVALARTVVEKGEPRFEIEREFYLNATT